jgi:osmoprotectant transport system ATP-binding protein
LLRLEPGVYRSKYPHQLSGGEQQRVGVARALAADPGLLLMDEPFAAVDPVTRTALQEEMLRIQRATGKTIVFVTHDIEEALRLASVIAVMEKGRLAQWGMPVEILEHPASGFVAEFVGGDGAELKLLALRRVSDRLRPGEIAGGDPLPADASLRDALAMMAARRVDRLSVVDAYGRPLGAITLADLIR